jgi:hypothetical protein
MWGAFILGAGLLGAAFGLYEGLDIYHAYQQVQNIARLSQDIDPARPDPFKEMRDRLESHVWSRLPWMAGEILLGVALAISGFRLLKENRKSGSR